MTYQFSENRISGGIGADDRYWESLEEGLEIGTPVHGIIAPPSPVSKGYATIQWVLGRRPDAPAEKGGAG